MVQSRLRLFCCAVALIWASNAIAQGPAVRASSDQPTKDIEGDWTCVYQKSYSGLADRDATDQGFGFTRMRLLQGRIEYEDNRPSVGVPSYRLYSARPEWIDFFRVNAKGEVMEETVVRASYAIRDDFLILSRGTSVSRPDKFRVDPTFRPAVGIWRRGRLARREFAAAPKSAAPVKEAATIHGDWIKIYHESQDFYLSFARMEDLRSIGLGQRRLLPFAEHIPRRWKVGPTELVEDQAANDRPAFRHEYLLDPAKGTIDIIPLDRDGKRVESQRKLGVYSVLDDFLLICYRVADGNGMVERPPRVFSTGLNSTNVVLILRRSY